jgi:phosphohistidine phosphatase SixA
VEDLHFESKEAEEDDVRSLTEEGSSEVDEEAEVLSSHAVEEPLLEASR